MDFPADQILSGNRRAVARARVIRALECDHRALPPSRRRLGRRGTSHPFHARTPDGLFKKSSGSESAARKIPTRFNRRRDRGYCGDAPSSPRGRAASRSEEHTSELQSLAYLVCRLLLEKKN